MILAYARRQRYEPGSNVRDDDVRDFWLYLLPRLAPARVVAVGRPPASTVRAWSSMGVHLLEPPSGAAPSALASDVDLVYVAPGHAGELSDPTLSGAIRCVFDAGAAIYLAPSPTTPGASAELARTLGVSTTVELGPVDGPVAAAGVAGRAAWIVPPARTERRSLAARVLRLVLRRLGLTRAPATGFVGVVGVSAGFTAAPAERGVVFRSDAEPATAPPEFIRDAACAAGHDLAATTWRLLPPRGYRSQKVITLLPEAGVVVKLTQDARFNGTLENEAAALQLLSGRLHGDGLQAPRVLFVGEHAGLTLLGETLLPGAAFRSRSDGSSGCPVARAALDALVELAGAAASSLSGKAAAAALSELLERHRAVHLPPAGQVSFLARQIELIAESGNGFAPAFTHGDPTTFNILVSDDGRIGLVDWENAEPLGMPLWDLLYFTNAYAAWSFERSGRRWTPTAAQAALYEPSPFHGLLAGAVARYRAARTLPAELVPPLVFTFWMAVALREATRQLPGTAADAPWASLLARLVSAGETPGIVGLAHPAAT